MQRQLAEFDARIAALEASLGVTPSQDEQPQGNSDATASTAAVPLPRRSRGFGRSPYESGVSQRSPPKEVMGFPYVDPLGFVLVRGPNGEVDFSTKGYIRYLNQLDLDQFYTDSFGRTTNSI